MDEQSRGEDFAWPDYFPDGCPPDDAALANGRVIRLVNDAPPTSDDFVPHVLLYPDTDFGDRTCDACGLSVFRSIEDAVRLTRAVPRFRNHKLAVGDLNASLGLLKHTPNRDNSHHTWWLPSDENPTDRFSVVELEEGEASEGSS